MFVLKGIYAPIPTPFVNDRLALDKLKSNIAHWVNTDLEGLVVMGSNGEFVVLHEQEKLELIAKTCEYTEGKKNVIAGTGVESTRHTIELSNKAAELGAKAVLVVTPNYYKRAMSEHILKKYYLDVAEAAKVPVIVYNMPANTGVNLSAKLVCELAEHPNIIGIKDTGGDIVQIAEIIKNSPDDFVVFAGSASFLFASLVLGAKGGTLALANIFPNECALIPKLVEAGDYQAARDLQLKLLESNQAVTARYGIGGLKAVLDMMGLYGGDPRAPLQPLSESDRQELKQIIERTGLISLAS